MKPPPVGVVRIGTGNVYSGNPQPDRAVKVATSTGAHSFGFNEGKNLVRRGHLDNLAFYRSFSAEGLGFEIPTDANDCPIIVRKNLNVIHFSVTKACDAIPDKEIAHARTYTVVGYDVPRWDAPFFHIEIHPNWVQGVTKGPVLEEFINSMYVLGRLIDYVQSLTPFYAVAGDFNITEREANSRSHASPYSVCNRFNMRGKSHRLDAIYWSRLLELNAWNKIPKRLTKSDHPYWLVADLKRK